MKDKKWVFSFIEIFEEYLKTTEIDMSIEDLDILPFLRQTGKTYSTHKLLKKILEKNDK